MNFNMFKLSKRDYNMRQFFLSVIKSEIIWSTSGVPMLIKSLFIYTYEV